MLILHAWVALNHQAKDTVVVLRVLLPGLVVLRPMMLATLMAALLATAILVVPLEALPPKAEETMLLEMVESPEEVTGGLKTYLNAMLGGNDRLKMLTYGVHPPPTVFSPSSSS